MPDRDRQIAEVARQLDDLLDDLAASVAALNAILTAAPPPGAADERLATP
jgi:hypothetical protein